MRESLSWGTDLLREFKGLGFEIPQSVMPQMPRVWAAVVFCRLKQAMRFCHSALWFMLSGAMRTTDSFHAVGKHIIRNFHPGV